MNAPDREPFALGGVDPLIALGAEQARRIAVMNAPNQEGDVSAAEHDTLTKIEEQIETLVPISPEGAVALVRYLKYRMDGFEWCEVDDQMADNLIEYLEGLQPG